jgi:hypothetical protein
MSTIPLFGNSVGTSPVNSIPSRGRELLSNGTHSITPARTPKAFKEQNLMSRTLDRGTPKIQIIRSRQVVQSSGSEDSDSDSGHSDVFTVSDSAPPKSTHAPSIRAPNPTIGMEPQPLTAKLPQTEPESRTHIM